MANIQGAKSQHLAGRRIVLAIAGSIAAVKTVELARELVRHGAEVHPVMTPAATRIIHPDAVGFGCGRPAVVHLGGQVEHVSLLGDVPEKADLLLVAPATANTVSKMALGIDDSTVTTCASVAFGTRVPVVVAPAMHDAMLRHPVVQQHVEKLLEMGVTWVEPRYEEHKAKLADVDAIVEAVIHRLAARSGPLAGKRALVIGGATAERVDDVRILTNRSSGATAVHLATALRRLGADVAFWAGHMVVDPPPGLVPVQFRSHADLQRLAASLSPGSFDQVWLPAAISDYVPEPHQGKIPSGSDDLAIRLRPVPKIAPMLRRALPKATVVLWKAEASREGLEERARQRLVEHGADHIIANTTEAFGAAENDVIVVSKDGTTQRVQGTKQDITRRLAEMVAGAQVAS